MTVWQLITALAAFPPEAQVVIDMGLTYIGDSSEEVFASLIPARRTDLEDGEPPFFVYDGGSPVKIVNISSTKGH